MNLNDGMQMLDAAAAAFSATRCEVESDGTPVFKDANGVRLSLSDPRVLDLLLNLKNVSSAVQNAVGAGRLTASTSILQLHDLASNGSSGVTINAALAPVVDIKGILGG